MQSTATQLMLDAQANATLNNPQQYEHTGVKTSSGADTSVVIIVLYSLN